ncbi:Orotate phosphoribosyltransferase [Wolbachia endosymbiont of Drosophila simulans wNo]|uniref:orotate phosphoribosyltransferase n=1 Tax=Wolbachia TaxID=953 RepID=UPI0002D2510C|nr:MULTISPECIES: orotate phosphoribosyltransferase [Wolbachia]AGJ98582.1 Orotate phosphoribosyltransferase [Wolbachia endosymbiont of Drosophila simulans wNo]QCB62777.1 orotate phosphoribosyltransferase [Wolbachia endosymbiont of Drosophila mauritiana]QCB63822.1 orotate phosphoribosyltransferase [Wolbachia endosymbiont of Drosophila mauritiana]QWE33917.1 Orotate phosphoribosyltransferase [Wolbachia endosymbiont of Drosophila simulans]TGB07659.1 orotate phosphoribosyltransferase [Wolbachia endo
MILDNTIIKEFEEAGAILHGHFVLSSGLHSNTYIQCAKIFENPSRAMNVCELLANKIRKEIIEPVDLILSPAIGGIIVGYEIGRQLGIRTIFCERVNGKFELRRGFEIKQGEKILLIEDVITTGKSSLEAVKCAEEKGGKVVAEASLIKRNSETKLPFPVISLIELNIENYSEEELPRELKQLPITKPGSREYLTK